MGQGGGREVILEEFHPVKWICDKSFKEKTTPRILLTY
jgi:hypothetical protein